MSDGDVRKREIENCHAYLLAGGKSSRFGSNKALVTIDGQPLLLGLIASLKNTEHQVHVVADRVDR